MEGEEVLLMGVKLMIIGKGFIPHRKEYKNHNYLSLVNLSIKLISSEYLPSMVIYGISHVNL